MGAMKITFLGTGTSVGVPVIGCECRVCRSQDFRNRRLRSSILIEAGEDVVLVDSGPDLRQQALREGIRRVDAVFYTHAHMDHVVGFDELRAFCWRREGGLPIYATRGCMETLQQMFAWAFAEENQYRGYVRPVPRVLTGAVRVGGIGMTPVVVEHGSVETVGYVIEVEGCGRVAYVPDVKVIPEMSKEVLRGVEVMIVDALRPGGHPTHFSVEESLAAIEELEVGQAWLTHLGHENDHQELQGWLPESVRVAWDGLVLEF